MDGTKHVTIRCADDEVAGKVLALLEALGCSASRELTQGEDWLPRYIDRVAQERRLPLREQEMLHGILTGQSSSELAQRYGISSATVKWHMHCLFTHMGVATREALLAAALAEAGAGR